MSSISETQDLAQFSVIQVLSIGDGRPDYGNMLACLRELRELFRGDCQSGHSKHTLLCSGNAKIGGDA